MKFTEKINNTRSGIKNKIYYSFIPKDVKVIIGIVVGIVVLVLISVIAAYAVNANAHSSVGSAIENAECIPESTLDKTCAKDLICFVPLIRNNTASTTLSGTCIRIPTVAGLGAYCTNSSSGPNCETGSSCQFVQVDTFASAAKCLKM